MFAWTEERKEGRKEGRQINLSGYVKQTVLSNIRQSSVYTLYITTIPKDPCSFLLFSKRILCLCLTLRVPIFTLMTCSASLPYILTGRDSICVLLLCY